MTNHIAVGVVADDQVEFAVFNGSDQFVGHFRGAHLRLQIIGGYIRGFHQNAGFAGVFFFAATGEEEGNVGVFFGFGNAQLGQAQIGYVFANAVAQRGRREGTAGFNIGGVFGQHDKVG